MVGANAAALAKGETAGTQAPHRFVALDSLRGLAAMLVVAFHLEGRGPLLSSRFVANGWLAVDFFFVLSGFVIGAAYARHLAGGMPFGRFMLLRLGRIYPVHLAVLVALVAYEAALAAMAQAGLPTARPGFGGDLAHSWDGLWKTLLLVQALFPGEPPSWNAQSWSISVELWLYVGIALLMRLAGMRGIVVALAASLGALALYASGFSAWHIPFTSEIARGVAGFGIGVALWSLFDRSHGALARLSPAAFAMAEAVAAIAVVLAISSYDSGPGFVLVEAVFACLIFVLAQERGLLSRLLSYRPFVWPRAGGRRGGSRWPRRSRAAGRSPANELIQAGDNAGPRLYPKVVEIPNFG